MLNFKVYAGNMYCGTLCVLPGLSHNFLSRSNRVVCRSKAINQVKRYKHLRLVKLNNNKVTQK